MIAEALAERIFYLLPEQAPLRIAQKLFDEMAGGFNLRADIDFDEPRDQKVSSLLVTATNNLSFSLFDRSDESMVNDYEALLTGIDAGTDVIGFFSDLIDQFLLKNPIAVRADVNKEWDDKPMPQRLVFDSPLPLVEEQRKILSAIKHPDARFIAVEGPPGTGKSHTITAVAFDLILSGKSLLVLSDKKEALDVVEDKLNQALAKVRPTEDFPNPILRLGKDASNYAQLLKKSAIERLDVNQRVVRKGRPGREVALKILREQPVKARFIAVPKVDYVGTKSKIESLNTQTLAEHIDERFIEFYDTKKNDALALGKIIREKKRFPIDKFADIQRAFPCIIAGLRDYAEFIPLEREIFDLVIIDEASPSP